MSARAKLVETISEPVSVPTPAAQKMSVVVVEEIDALARYSEQWEALSERAIEPNPFYEPWMLLPAIRAFGANRKLKFVLIFDPTHANPSGWPALRGFFPLEIKPAYEGLGTKLPLRTLSLWRHKYCYICTPLVSAGRARDTVDAFFEWVESENLGCPLMEFEQVPGEGPFRRLLVDHFNESGRISFVSESFTRALFRPSACANDYLSLALPGIRRKELRRLEKRLSEAGRLDYCELGAGGEIGRWISEFLELESISWKGQEGRALLSRPEDRDFFVEAARSAFDRGRLMMLALRVGGRPIAVKCNFMASDGSFAFKIAYDDEYARFSPGVLLEMENIRRLHDRPGTLWMDSCANPDNFMINRLWPDRLTIQSIVIASGRTPGGLVVSSIPMLKWLNRKLLRRGVSR
ncbi:MAG TPA: GNAT family N-acetyltransferase [Blastocatellia bacterium]|nr:GNAT family N-acetyltransferase [Blastocatellia bacterium]